MVSKKSSLFVFVYSLMKVMHLPFVKFSFIVFKTKQIWKMLDVLYTLCQGIEMPFQTLLPYNTETF